MTDLSPIVLSVLVPMAPGESEAPGLLEQLRELPIPAEILLLRSDARPHEVLSDWPGRIGLRQIDSPGRRARQMNAGAAVARGQWLWFLHADTRLGPGCLEGLADFVAQGDRALGWFRLAFRDDGPRLAALNAAGANWRARYLGIPFGDQGFVIRAADFASLGGYDEKAPYGEDHLFVWSARQAGIRPRRINATLATSARKYARLGWARTTLLHWRLTFQQAWPAWRRLRRGR